MIYTTTQNPKCPTGPCNYLAYYKPLLLCDLGIHNGFIGSVVNNGQTHMIINNYYHDHLYGIYRHLAINIHCTGCKQCYWPQFQSLNLSYFAKH